MSMNGSSLTPTMTSVHQPVIEDREPPVRREDVLLSIASRC